MLFVEAITMIFTGITITFVKQLCFGLWLTLPLLLSIAAGIVCGKRPIASKSW